MQPPRAKPLQMQLSILRWGGSHPRWSWWLLGAATCVPVREGRGGWTPDEGRLRDPGAELGAGSHQDSLASAGT